MSAKGPYGADHVIQRTQDAGRREGPYSLMHQICATHKFALTISQIGHEITVGGWDVEVLMRYLDASLLLPCPHCGHRMLIATVEPAQLAEGVPARDLQDVTHSCVQCGTRLTRTIRSLSGAA
jgi:hypothetical protein